MKKAFQRRLSQIFNLESINENDCSQQQQEATSYPIGKENKEDVPVKQPVVRRRPRKVNLLLLYII